MKIEIPNKDNREFNFSNEHLEKIKKILFSEKNLKNISQAMIEINRIMGDKTNGSDKKTKKI